MLGVIIGVASVIAMIALGSGARAAIDEQIQSQGTNVIYRLRGQPRRARAAPTGARAPSRPSPSRTPRRSSARSRRSGTLDARRARAGPGDRREPATGTRPSRAATRTTWRSATGRSPRAPTSPPRDVLVADKVCLLGATVARTLFPDRRSGRPGHPRAEHALPRARRAGAPRARASGARTRTTSWWPPTPRSRRSCSGSPTSTRSRSRPARASWSSRPRSTITRLMRAATARRGPEDDDFSVRTIEEMAATREPDGRDHDRAADERRLGERCWWAASAS